MVVPLGSIEPGPEVTVSIAVVNALAKAGIDLGENGSVIPRQKGKPR
jgi:hypothetical protein